MNLDTVTVRWAEALFRLAERAQALTAVQASLARISQALAPAGASAWLLDRGAAGRQRKTQLLQAAGEVHPLVQQFVGLAFDKGRALVLLQVGEAFRQRALLAQGVVEGIVESARPLEASAVEDLARALGKELAKSVRLEARTNPDLIGGVRVVVGARMLDRSVQGRLESLRQRLLSARLPVQTS